MDARFLSECLAGTRQRVRETQDAYLHARDVYLWWLHYRGGYTAYGVPYDDEETVRKYRHRWKRITEERYAALAVAAADLRAVRNHLIAELLPRFRPRLLAMLERGPEYYQRGVRTGDWTSYKEFSRLATSCLDELKSFGLTVRDIMLS